MPWAESMTTVSKKQMIAHRTSRAPQYSSCTSHHLIHLTLHLYFLITLSKASRSFASACMYACLLTCHLTIDFHPRCDLLHAFHAVLPAQGLSTCNSNARYWSQPAKPLNAPPTMCLMAWLQDSTNCSSHNPHAPTHITPQSQHNKACPPCMHVRVMPCLHRHSSRRSHGPTRKQHPGGHAPKAPI